MNSIKNHLLLFKMAGYTSIGTYAGILIGSYFFKTHYFPYPYMHDYKDFAL